MATMTKQGLTKAQTEQFRRRLLDKAVEIRGNMQTNKAGEALHVERLADQDDLANLSHDQWIFLNRNNIDTMLLREIQDSLTRIEDGEYGLCMECEEPMSLKRLEAIPWARHCVSCQEELAALEEEERAKAEQTRRR